MRPRTEGGVISCCWWMIAADTCGCNCWRARTRRRRR
uniref:Uncharacterized protein n=1 Tax=Arundo donax TaxID=35708 RepID=A0A0A9BUB3_ARUDO